MAKKVNENFSKRGKNKNKADQTILNQKPTLTFMILKKIFEMGVVALDSFFPAKYPEARLWRCILGLDSSHKFSKPTFEAILSRLQKQGLVERQLGKWSITALGKTFFGKMRFKRKTELPARDGIMRLVIFDVPERDRKKRLWLRLELTACDYQLLQKSVWVGYCPLPQEFFEALEYLNLRNQVHIFSVNKIGTLQEI